MSKFSDATVTQRVAIRDTAYRLGKMSERLTMGHGPLTAGLGAVVDGFGQDMAVALQDAGYSSTTDTQVVVSDGDKVSVQTSGHSVVAADGTAEVSAGVLSGITMPSNITGVRDGVTSPVADASGKTANTTVKVTNGDLASQIMESTATIVKDGGTVTVGSTTYTFTVANGAITAITTA